MYGTQIILGTCPSKSNSYKIVKLGQHASLAKTKALTDYEKNFFIQCDKYRNADIKGYFEIEIKVMYPNERADLDNSLKIVMDCLQKVKAFQNDNKCVAIHAYKFKDANNPRIEFSIKKAMAD